MNKDKQVVDMLYNAINNKKPKTSSYDTTATVKRVKGNTAWVHIPGGVDETPVKMTVNAQVGDTVQVRVGGGRAWLTGNATAPPTDDKTAKRAMVVGQSAAEAANLAWLYADEAHTAAEQAKESANIAEQQAISATNSANNALTQLSTVEDVVDTLNWITNHGTMTSQAGQEFDPLKVYFVLDQDGDYVVADTHYSLVTEPVAEDIDSYYCLTIDEAVSNYVASHLSLTNAGLYVLKDGSGYKVLVANTEVAIQNPSGATVASYGETAVTGQNASGYSRTEVSGSGLQVIRKVGQPPGTTDIILADIGYGSGASQSGTASAPFASFGVRDPRSPGNYSLMGGYNVYASGYCSQAFGNGSTASGSYSHAEGLSSTASGSASHAEGGSTASGANAHSEGLSTTASGNRSHAEGNSTTASGQDSHSEGNGTSAGGRYSHAQNWGTIASGNAQTAIGMYNIEHSGNTVSTPAFIIGNGSASNRSDAFTVDWSGNVNIPSGAEYRINGTALSASDVGAVPTSRTVNGHALTGNVTVTASDVGAVAKSVVCYANSRVDSFDSNGNVSIALSSLGITTGARPVGILLTHQNSGIQDVAGKRTVILQYDYDNSNSTSVLIRAHHEDGTPVTGNVRYFAVVFQSSWTSPT